MTSNTFVFACIMGLTWAGSGAASAAGESEGEQVRIIQTDSNTRRVELAAIDSERFELGSYAGMLSVEDFGSDLVSGIELNYHVRDAWLLQVSYGRANIDKAAFETNQRRFLAGDDRRFEYIAISGGYQLVAGRSFFGARHKFNSGIYLLAGPERLRFAANEEWGLSFGISYRTVFTDWLTGNVDFREHWFERRFIGDTKQTFNTELRIGVNMLF